MTPADQTVGGTRMSGPSGKQSPVDLVCKAHDKRYDAAYLTKDPLRRAMLIQAADLILLRDVVGFYKDIATGKNNIDMNELFFSHRMTIAFGFKLMYNGEAIANVNADRQLGRQRADLIRRSKPMTMIVLGLPRFANASTAPRRVPPAHRPKPTIIRIQGDVGLATALGNIRRQDPVSYSGPRADD